MRQRARQSAPSEGCTRTLVSSAVSACRMSLRAYDAALTTTVGQSDARESCLHAHRGGHGAEGQAQERRGQDPSGRRVACARMTGISATMICQICQSHLNSMHMVTINGAQRSRTLPEQPGTQDVW